MIDIDKLVRENVRKLTPYSCARDEFKGSSGTFMDANENPFGTLNRYPDPYQMKLKAAIAPVKGVSAENIFLGNGSDEIIDLCFRIFCNPGVDKVLTFTPTYGMYEVSASVNDIEVIKIPLTENFQIDLPKVTTLLSDQKIKLMFICSPNNPTSNSMNFGDVEDLISSFRGIVVIDEAYIDFTDKPSFIGLIEKYPNLIVMQTFSKAFAMAAVRVGMAFMAPAVITYFNRIKPPYNISTINQDAVIRKLGNMEICKSQVLRIKHEREKLTGLLKSFDFVKKVYPSDANFLLVKVENAGKLYAYLIDRNIIVRNRHSVIDNCVRITVGKPSENNKLIKALQAFSI
jgi:histidinol-phosphate aminotransferase